MTREQRNAYMRAWSKKNKEKKKAWDRRYQLESRDKYLAYQKKWRVENYLRTRDDKNRKRTMAEGKKREYLNRFKMRPCSDCFVQYNPWVMHLDHRDPSTKLYSIGRQLKAFGWKALFEELKKVDVVCANCHAERTHKQIASGIFLKYQKGRKPTTNYQI